MTFTLDELEKELDIVENSNDFNKQEFSRSTIRKAFIRLVAEAAESGFMRDLLMEKVQEHVTLQLQMEQYVEQNRQRDAAKEKEKDVVVKAV